MLHASAIRRHGPCIGKIPPCVYAGRRLGQLVPCGYDNLRSQSKDGRRWAGRFFS
jgi:hypothetical protein